MKTISPEKTRAILPVKISDTTVTGLLAGLAAGLVMLAFLLLMGILRGADLGRIIANFSPLPDGRISTGFLAHLGVSCVYGLLFGLLWGVALKARWFSPGPLAAALIGLAFGLLLWAVALLLTPPALAEMLQSLPPGSFLAAHLIYGAVVGALTGRHSPGYRADRTHHAA